MKEQYVSFEVAQILKEKNFDWECRSYYEYFSSDVTLFQGMLPELSEAASNFNNKGSYICSRPTQQMACDWLREEHEINIIPVIQHRWRYSQESPFKEYSCRVYDSDGNIVMSATKWYNRYENAVEAALEYALRNLI